MTVDALRSDEIVLDAESHTYVVRGDVYTSVTRALSLLHDFSAANPDVLERASQFGTAVHEMVRLDLRKELDESSLDQALSPWLATWRHWLRQTEWQLILSEYRIASLAHRYAGTLDLAFITKTGALVVADIKTGQVSPTVGPQVAAYLTALRQMAGYPFGASLRAKPTRYCLALRADDVRLIRLNDESDFSIFLSALNCHRFREHHGNSRLTA